MTAVDDVWEGLSEAIGDHLRAVTRFRATEFETRMRDDVRRNYTEREDQRVVDQVVLDQLLSKELEQEFKCGDLTGTVHIFQEAWILVQAHPEFRKRGYIVSIDRTDDLSMADLEACFELVRRRTLERQ
jgi:hypothetical protein